jgi:(p)ppGpp synthase/HD superfamily hydrolase
MSTSKTFEEALVYATQLHRDQVRKGTGAPYITHLMGVAAIAGEYGGDEEQMIAGLLHDGPEDQGGKVILEQIRERFGERVARIVADCSDTFESPKPPWKARKETYIAHLKDAPDDSRLVSASDKLHNSRSILKDLHGRGESLWEIFKGGKEGSKWYYRTLQEEYAARGPKELADEIERVLDAIDQVSPD